MTGRATYRPRPGPVERALFVALVAASLALLAGIVASLAGVAL